MFIGFALANTFDMKDSTRVFATTIYSFIYLGSVLLNVLILIIYNLVKLGIWVYRKYKTRHSASSSVVGDKETSLTA